MAPTCSASWPWLALAALVACRGEEPAPDTADPLEDEPTIAVAASPASARLDGDDASDSVDPAYVPGEAPTSARAFFAALPVGVVSRELVGECREYAAVGSLVARAERCAEAPTGPGCDAPVELGVAGMNEDGQVAIVSAPWVEPCGGPRYYRVFEATPPWLRPDTTTTYAPSDGPIAKALAWVAGRAKRHYAPVENMVRYACELEAWTTPLERLAVLRDPLEGWMLTIARGRRALPVKLIAPGNKRVHELGVIDLGPGLCDTEGTSRDDICLQEVSASIEQIALSASRRTIVLTARIATGDRCASQRVIHVGLRLPDGVRSVMKKPLDHGIQRRGSGSIQVRNHVRTDTGKPASNRGSDED